MKAPPIHSGRPASRASARLLLEVRAPACRPRRRAWPRPSCCSRPRRSRARRTLGQRDGLAAPAHRLGPVAIEHAQVGLDAVREARAGPGGSARSTAMARRLAASASGVAAAPGRGRQRSPRGSRLRAARSPRVVVDLDRLAPGAGRLVEAVHQHALVRVGLQEPRALGRRRGGGEAQGAGVLVGGLAMRAERGGAGGGGGRMGQDRGGVAGALGVVGEARQVGSSPRAAWRARAAPARGARAGGAARSPPGPPAAPARGGRRAARPGRGASRGRRIPRRRPPRRPPARPAATAPPGRRRARPRPARRGRRARGGRRGPAPRRARWAGCRPRGRRGPR